MTQCIIPIIHADGSREARAYSWDVAETRRHQGKLLRLFVHADAEVDSNVLLGDTIKTPDANIFHMPHFTRRWDTDYLEEAIQQAIVIQYGLDDRSQIRSFNRDLSVTGVFNQSLTTDQMTSGFTYEIRHNEEYNPSCAACAFATKTVHDILGEWLKEAIFVEKDWEEVLYFVIKDTKKIVILPKSDKPQVERILNWFVENFNDTVRMASIESIMFRDYDTNVCYEHIITY